MAPAMMKKMSTHNNQFSLTGVASKAIPCLLAAGLVLGIGIAWRRMKGI